MAFLVYWFQVTASHILKCLDDRGGWALFRCPFNDRGDEATIGKRVNGLESVGWIPTARKSPYVIQRDNPQHFDISHFATILEAAFRVWKNNPQSLQIMELIRDGIKDTLVFRKTIPPYGRRYLCYAGNILNAEVAITTVLQIWRASAHVNATFNRRKDPLWAERCQPRPG